jgi:hypothetical protein
LGTISSCGARPELFGVSVEAGQSIDVLEFLWASLALFDDAVAAETATLYRPLSFELYQVAEVRDRILRLLAEAEAPEGAPLERFLPDPSGGRKRSACPGDAASAVKSLSANGDG